MSKIVIALGGNALGNSPKEQLEIVKETAKPIVDLIEKGHEVIIVHGNGPQVGMINLYMEGINMPFPECTSMSQGYIGYHLQNSIKAEMENRDIDKNILTVITQVVVDSKDPALRKPTKPIGEFYSKEEADKIEKEKGYKMVEDSGRGYRRVVPSPKPIDIVEKNSIKTLVDKGHIVITVGGGGIPVIKKEFGYEGIDGVIDKDFASSKIGELVEADYLFILTAVDKVSINYGKSNQKDLDQITIDEAYKYIDEGQFAPGSMLPKVLASIDFVKSKGNRKAIIGSLSKAKEALIGKSGTVISN